MKQTHYASKKKQGRLSNRDIYLESIKQAPGVAKLLEAATLKSDLKSTSDWSYSASAYASPYLRIVGDTGCFIDPLFSSGVHLALTSGLSAAVTVCAARRGHCTEDAAVNWHTRKVAEGYTLFLLVVASALKQIGGRDEHILNDWDEYGFDRAFELFKPSMFRPCPNVYPILTCCSYSRNGRVIWETYTA